MNGAPDIQHEVTRARELARLARSHCKKAGQAMDNINEVTTRLGESLLCNAAAGTALGNHEFEVTDTLSAWRAARDRLRPENGGSGISDAISVLLNASYLRRRDDTPPPAVLSVARAAATIVGECMASGYFDAEPEVAHVRDLVGGMVSVLEAVLE